MFYISLNSRGYKLQLKTTPQTAFSIDNDAYNWNIQRAATFFPSVKCSRGRDLNKCQIPAFLGLNSRQLPGGCLEGGMGTLGFDSHITGMCRHLGYYGFQAD